jgi:hypothetical protein
MFAIFSTVSAMLATKPNDRNIQTVVERLGHKLEAAYEKERQSEVTNPLQAAIDLLALTEEDVSKWMQVFKRIDKKHTSRVTLTDLFEYFEETPTAITREAFMTSDVLDREGLIEFGDFIRSCGVFCMFGKKELIQYVLHWFPALIFC